MILELREISANIDLEQSETNVSWRATEAVLNLTTDSYLGGGDLICNSTPAGISGSGINSIIFNPSSLSRGGSIPPLRGEINSPGLVAACKKTYRKEALEY